MPDFTSLRRFFAFSLGAGTVLYSSLLCGVYEGRGRVGWREREEEREGEEGEDWEEEEEESEEVEVEPGETDGERGEEGCSTETSDWEELPLLVVSRRFNGRVSLEDGSSGGLLRRAGEWE